MLQVLHDKKLALMDTLQFEIIQGRGLRRRRSGNWLWCLRDLLDGSPLSLLGPLEYYKNVCWIPTVLPYVCQVNYMAQGLKGQCIKVNPLGITEGRDKGKEAESG